MRLARYCACVLFKCPPASVRFCSVSIVMAKHRTLYSHEDDVRINISPMIDMVFILLIFFIVTTVFVDEVGMDVDKPSRTVSQRAGESEPVLISVTKNNNVFHKSKEIGLNGVRSMVSHLLAKKTAPVIIEVDAQVSSGFMVRVMDEARLGGAEEISVSTSKE